MAKIGLTESIQQSHHQQWDEEVCSETWSVPLSWAVALIKKVGSNVPEGEDEPNHIIIPKDHKDLVASLLKYRAGLDSQKSRADNRMPEFYKRVILL